MSSIVGRSHKRYLIICFTIVISLLVLTMPDPSQANQSAGNCSQFTSVSNEIELSEAITCFNSQTTQALYQIKLENDINLTSELTAIDNPMDGIRLSIYGNDYTIDGGKQFRSGFVIESSTNLTVYSTSFVDGIGDRGGAFFTTGTLVISNSNFLNNVATQDVGGGVYSANANTIIIDSIFKDNWAEGGAAIFTYMGILKVYNSRFENNGNGSAERPFLGSGTGNGGAIGGNFGTLSIHNSTFTGNSGSGFGGAIYTDTDSTLIEKSTFINNSAGSRGGAIYSSSNYLRIANSSFGSNSTRGEGGAINSNSRIELLNSTIYGNTARDNGGGLFISHNSRHISIQNSIIAGNTAGDCFIDNSFGSSYIHSSINNLIQNSGMSACTLTNGIEGNQIGVNPLVEMIADNGGLTWTFKLDPLSPAIGAGNADVCQSGLVSGVDQRSYFRGEACDVGAYELDGFFPVYDHSVWLPIVIR